MRTKNIEQEELIRKFESNPVYFIEVFIGRELSKKQRLFLKKTMTAKHIVNIWSRQTGKSTVVASYIIWRILYGKGCIVNKEHMNEQIAIVAPIKEQHINIYDKIVTLINKSPFIANFLTKVNSERIVAKNGNSAKFMSASPGSQIRGYTATCIVIDESQDITDNKYSGDILPFGATTNALVIEAGTPKTKNHFYNVQKSKEVCVIKQPWFECPFLSESYVMSQKLISPDSLWRQEYLCEFVEEGVLAFPSVLFEPEMKNGKKTGRWNLAEYDWVRNVNEMTQKKVAEVINNTEATYIAGCDLGKQKDQTVFVVYRDDIRPIRRELQFEFPLGTKYSDIAKIIGQMYKIYGWHEFNIDYTNEKGFVEMLQSNDVPVVIKPKRKKNQKTNIIERGAIAFTNKNKQEMVNTAVVLLENFHLQLPLDDEKTLKEFLNQQYETNDIGQVKYYHPSNENDDALWATLLALKNVTHYTVVDVTNFVNPWNKHDEMVRGDDGRSVNEVTIANKKYNEKRRKGYKTADQRRSARQVW